VPLAKTETKKAGFANAADSHLRRVCAGSSALIVGCFDLPRARGLVGASGGQMTTIGVKGQGTDVIGVDASVNNSPEGAIRTSQMKATTKVARYLSPAHRQPSAGFDIAPSSCHHKMNPGRELGRHSPVLTGTIPHPCAS